MGSVQGHGLHLSKCSKPGCFLVAVGCMSTDHNDKQAVIKALAASSMPPKAAIHPDVCSTAGIDPKQTFSIDTNTCGSSEI